MVEADWSSLVWIIHLDPSWKNPPFWNVFLKLDNYGSFGEYIPTKKPKERFILFWVQACQHMSTWLFRLCNLMKSNASRHWDGVVGTDSAHQHCANDANDVATNDDLHWPVFSMSWPTEGNDLWTCPSCPSGTLSQATETAPNSSTNHGCTMFEHVKPYHLRHPRHPKLDSDSTCSLPNFFERRFAKRFPSPAKRFKEPKTACSNQSGPNLKHFRWPMLSEA